jgi:glycosyltransferase involved in cell wall biosynthesis
MARRIGTDIYHGTFQVLPFVAAAPLSVLTIHDMAVFAYPAGYGSRFVQYMRFVLPRSIRRARAIIAVSDATKAEIVRLMPEVESKIVTILNGVSTAFVDACSMRPEAVGAVRQKLALPPQYVLYVGNLEPKKNLPRLLDGFNRLKATSGLPHKLVITGKQMSSGPGSGITMSEEQLRSLAHFTGYVDETDLPALYRGADVVAYPSIYEGFGMPVLEGLAAGVPVVTSNVSSLPEVAGGAALTVDPFDPEAIARGLAQALTDQAWRNMAIRRGLARASELTWHANAQRTAALYQELWTRSLMGRVRGH